MLSLQYRVEAHAGIVQQLGLVPEQNSLQEQGIQRLAHIFSFTIHTSFEIKNRRSCR